MASTVTVNIVGNAGGLKKATEEAEGHLSKLGGKVAAFGAGLVAGFGLDQVVGAVRGAIDSASDLNEALSKNKIVFGEGADQISNAAEGAAKSVGLSKKAYEELAGTVGVLGKAAGKTGDQLGDFGNEVIARAADIGSFNNAATSDVIEAWGAAMRGEMEPMRKFGVLLDDAALRAQALKMGLVDNVKDALTPQTKALAANALIMAQTKDAAGDFARTSDGLANKQRILGAQVENLKTKFGEKLLPVFSAVVGFVSDKLGPALAKVAAVIGPVIQKIIEGVQLFIGAFTGAGADVEHLSGGMIDKIIYWADRTRAVFDSVVAFVRENFPKVQAVVQTVVEALVVAFQWVQANVIPVVEQVVAYVSEQFGHLVDWVQKNWPAISEAIGHVMNAIKDVIEFVVTWATKFWNEWGDNIIAIAIAAWNAIRAVIETALGIIRGIIMAVVSAINGDWGKAWDAIKGALGAAWDGIHALLRGAVIITGQILAAIWKPIGDTLFDMWTSIKGIWDGIVGWVSGLPARIADAAAGMWDGFKNAFRNALNWIISKWNGLEFHVPGIDLGPLGSFGGVTVGVPDIPYLAKGGIVTKPTLAMIGEAGPEAVVPLGKGMGGNTYNLNFYMLKADAQVGNAVIDAIAAAERVSGTGWRS